MATTVPGVPSKSKHDMKYTAIFMFPSHVWRSTQGAPYESEVDLSNTSVNGSFNFIKAWAGVKLHKLVPGLQLGDFASQLSGFSPAKNKTGGSKPQQNRHFAFHPASCIEHIFWFGGWNSKCVNMLGFSSSRDDDPQWNNATFCGWHGLKRPNSDPSLPLNTHFLSLKGPREGLNPHQFHQLFELFEHLGRLGPGNLEAFQHQDNTGEKPHRIQPRLYHHRCPRSCLGGEGRRVAVMISSYFDAARMRGEDGEAREVKKTMSDTFQSFAPSCLRSNDLRCKQVQFFCFGTAVVKLTAVAEIWCWTIMEDLALVVSVHMFSSMIPCHD